jgi:xylulokinase
MRENNMNPSIIRAGKANMFLSDVFTQSFVNFTGVPVELHQTDGSIGAALGAGLGAAIYSDARAAFSGVKPITIVTPVKESNYNLLYQRWREILDNHLTKYTQPVT